VSIRILVSIFNDDEYCKGFPVSIEPLTPDRRRAMTREHLLRAAAAVFARHGFHGASLDEVAAAAGFTKGAVYSNFKSKEDLFVAVLDERIRTQVGRFRTVLGDFTRPAEETQPLIRDIVDSTWDDEGSALFLEFVVYAARNPAAREKLAASFQRQHDEIVAIIGTEYERAGVPPRYPVDVLAVISSALFEGLGMTRLINPSLVTRETVDSVLQFLYDTTAASWGDARPDG
jgi:AcrR family transcriptional regulator